MVTQRVVNSHSGKFVARDRHEEVRRDAKSPRQLRKYFEVHDTSGEQMEVTKNNHPWMIKHAAGFHNNPCFLVVVAMKR